MAVSKKGKKKMNKDVLVSTPPAELSQMISNGEIDMVDVIQVYFPKASRKQLTSTVGVNARS